jgi:hypothetical protein
MLGDSETVILGLKRLFASDLDTQELEVILEYSNIRYSFCGVLMIPYQVSRFPSFRVSEYPTIRLYRSLEAISIESISFFFFSFFNLSAVSHFRTKVVNLDESRSVAKESITVSEFPRVPFIVFVYCSQCPRFRASQCLITRKSYPVSGIGVSTSSNNRKPVTLFFYSTFM